MKEKKYSSGGFQRLSATDLKMIALISMTIDHIGAALLPQYFILRIIGRLAFPIYCYLIVNGLFFSKNLKRYLARLWGFALVSEVFFDLAFYGKILSFEYQNVFFTLAIGLMVIAAIEKIKVRYGAVHFYLTGVAELLIVVFGCGLAWALRTDYSYSGVLMIYGFYAFRYQAVFSILFNIMINYWLLGGAQVFAVAALVPICMYNGEKGTNRKWIHWFFYSYYPFHLLVIYLIAIFTGLC